MSNKTIKSTLFERERASDVAPLTVRFCHFPPDDMSSKIANLNHSFEATISESVWIISKLNWSDELGDHNLSENNS